MGDSQYPTDRPDPTPSGHPDWEPVRRWEDLPRHMRLPFKHRPRTEFPLDWFETKSHAWEEAGLARQVAAKAARKARRQTLALTPVLVGILVLYAERKHIGSGLDEPIRWV